MKKLAELAGVAKLTSLNQHMLPGGADATVEIQAQVEGTNVWLWGFEEDGEANADAQPGTLVASEKAKTKLALTLPEVAFFPWDAHRTLLLASIPLVDGKPAPDHPGIVVRQPVTVSNALFAAPGGVLAAGLAYLQAVLALGRVRKSHSWDPVVSKYPNALKIE